MTDFYDILDALKNELRASPSVNTVTFGDITEVDLDKTSIFPLSHIMMKNVQYEDNILVFNLSIVFSDIVDYNKSETEFDDFYRNDNLQDVFNTQLQVAIILISKIRKAQVIDLEYELVGEPTLEPFKESFGNTLAGWTVDLALAIPNRVNTRNSDGEVIGAGGC